MSDEVKPLDAEELATIALGIEGLAALRPHYLSPVKIADDYKRLLATIAERDEAIAVLDHRLTDAGNDTLKAFARATSAAATCVRLREVVERLAIVKHYRPAIGGGLDPNGSGCKLCHAECAEGEPLTHKLDCVLTQADGER